MPRSIDTMHLGLDRVIGAWERRGALIDPGPASTIETVLAALGEAPGAIFLTHIHLDHAGATGTIVARFPGVPVYVHEAGAPHLIDPARLLESARRLYGDDMERLWGEVLPVPEENLTTLTGGELIDGLRVLYTPGHASHHVSYVDVETGDAYVGDVMACGALGIVSEPYTDYKAIARRYADCFIAGEGDNRVLMRNNPAEIRAMVESMVETGRMSGGYMMCIGNHIPFNVPGEAVKLYFELSGEMGYR